VGLKDTSGKLHWARRADATSTYAQPQAPRGDSVTPILPRWSGVQQPTRDFAEEKNKLEVRVIEGRGWPWPALRADVSRTSGIVLPRRPLWPGFAGDVLVLSAIAAAVAWLSTRPARFLIESARARRGCCLRCGYDLRFDLAAGCPECGWRRDPATLAGRAVAASGQRV
jgi:hypothetical protein